jgi:hypothetical protein
MVGPHEVVDVDVRDPFLSLHGVVNQPIFAFIGFEDLWSHRFRRATIQPRGGPEGCPFSVPNGDFGSHIEEVTI